MMGTKPFIQVEGLVKYFQIAKGSFVHAVDGVSFHIQKGETVGLVGESGCGKTTVGRAMLRLLQADAGHVWLDGTDVLGLDKEALHAMRRRMQLIFQDPFNSLDPRKNVAQLIAEPLRIHTDAAKAALKEKTLGLMEYVGLTADLSTRFPHELDGGRCQRVGIARALALDPAFIVCDEPVSALDVSIQAQILNLLQDMQQERALTYLFISHNLAVVKHLSTRVLVMYLGQIVESAPTLELFAHPIHPYTQALLDAVPIPALGARKERVILSGDVPTPVNPAPGCRFRKRCRYACDACGEETPTLQSLGNEHYAACILANDGKAGDKS